MNLSLQEICDRMNDLEARFAFQDEVIAILNPQVAAQSRRVGRIEEELCTLRKELAALRNALGHDVASENPPPHF